MSRKNRRGVALKAKKSKLARLRALMATLHRHGGIKKSSPKGGAARQQVATMLRAHRRRARRKPFFGDGPKAQSTPVTQARFVTHDLKEKVKRTLQREKSNELFRKGRAARAARDAQDALLRAAAQAAQAKKLAKETPRMKHHKLGYKPTTNKDVRKGLKNKWKNRASSSSHHDVDFRTDR